MLTVLPLHIICRHWLLALLVLFFITPTHAMSVKPLLIEMESIGRSSSATLEVGNESGNKLPVEIIVQRVELNEKGESSFESAEKDWLIFPPQAVIAPGGQQNFRLQWLGDPEMKESQSFHFVVKQVPVDMQKAGRSGIQLVYNFRALVNVAPPNSRSELKVTKSFLEHQENEAPRVAFTLENNSSRHALLSNHELKLKLLDASGKPHWKQTLSPRDIFQTIGAGLVQPGKQRQFISAISLPAEAGQPGFTLQTQVSHEKRF